jgi:hypothetical protein
MSTTGKLTPKGNPSLRREASADDPIYTRGFKIGVTRSTTSSKNTQEKASNSENHKDSQDDWMDKATKALEVTPEEWQKVIEEHTFEEMEKEEKARKG